MEEVSDSVLNETSTLQAEWVAKCRGALCGCHLAGRVDGKAEVWLGVQGASLGLPATTIHNLR